MSAAGGGPTGAARPPPPWLSGVELPLTVHEAGSALVRVHRTALAPIHFSPGDDQPPAGRFDSATEFFGVLYLALSLEGAFVETVLRNPERRLVSLKDIAARSLAVLQASRDLRLVSMHGAGLQALGVDNSVTTGPYAPCSFWADALFAHPDRPDGITYASRHDPDQVCIALFSRPDLGLVIVSQSVPLAGMLTDVAAILRRYGKGLDT